MKISEFAAHSFDHYPLSEIIHSRFKQHFTHWLGAFLLMFAGTAYADHTPDHAIANLKGGLGAVEQRLWDCENGVGGACPGTPGADGAPGATGAQGPQGVTGATGPAGTNGLAGADGATGAQGDVGPQGPAGADGVAGADGATGADGTDGATGATGPKGNTGATGATGSQGIQGDQGPQGVAGNNGAAGADGLAGADGPPGPPGSSGQDGKEGLPGIDGLDGFVVYAIGDIGPAGGWVFYVTADGLHGLEAAPNDQRSVQWGFGCQSELPGIGILGADGTALGMGERNTDDIVAACPFWTEGAASIADNYTSPSGYFDWYLPSIGELIIMLNNLVPSPPPPSITSFSLDPAGPLPGGSAYWSSTEFDCCTQDVGAALGAELFQLGAADIATAVPVFKGNNVDANVGGRYLLRVRAVRHF